MTFNPRTTRSSVDTAQRSSSSWLYWLCIVIAIAALSPRIVQLLGNGKVIAASSNTVSASRHSDATKPRLVTKPIEVVRCGDRIASELPEGVQPEDQAKPDPATWRLVELELTKRSGDVVRISLLRPLTWLAQSGALSEGTFPIAVEELDLEGEAAVLQILPCPPISDSAGQVVTGTFQHTCDSLVEVRIASQSEPIVCTTGHPIWSETRQAFVDAVSLAAGEQVRTVSGEFSRVLSTTLRTEPVPVYNIEVNRTHTYLVGSSGLLVHNANSCVDGGDDPQASKGGLPGSSSLWGKNRLVKELHDQGFVLKGPTRSDGGLIYVNPTSGAEIRIMPRPDRAPFREEPIAKFLGGFYYRFRSGPDAPWGTHTALPGQ